MKRCIAILILVCGLILLSACQQSPEENVVISKNDGTFNANAAVSASETHALDATQTVEAVHSFTSSDGSVNFSIELHETLTDADMPVVEVSPHYLTEDDVYSVYQALFGNTPCYQVHNEIPESSLTKSEIAKKIERWTPYLSDSAEEELFGWELEGFSEVLKNFIEEYSLMLETAQEGERTDICQWVFQTDPDVGNQIITGELTVGDIPYRFSAARRNMTDFRLNNISAYPYGGVSPMDLDNAIFRARLFRTAEPSLKQLTQIQRQAEQMLAQMDVGQWAIDQCYVETHFIGSIPEYTVHLTAVPVLNGIPAVRMPQLVNLKSTESYASNYYLTDADFLFSADGRLAEFKLTSPIDIVRTVNTNVSVLPMDEILSLVEKNLALTDAYNYGYGIYASPESEDLACDVAVCKIAYSLVRVKVPDTDESYYYTPAVSVLGTVRLTGKESGAVYSESSLPEPLLVLNAVDGSVIALNQG